MASPRGIVGLVLVLGLVAVARAGEDDAPPPPVFEGRTAAAWVEQLASDQAPARRKAAYALFRMGDAASPGVLALVRAIGDDDEYVRTTSARAVEKVGAEAVRPAADDLAAWLHDERQPVRREAAIVLRRLGPLAAAVVPALTKALGSDDAFIRSRAAWCLGSAGSAGRPALARLAEAVTDDDEDVRRGAANALARIDPAAAFASEHAAVRLAALQAHGDRPAPGSWKDPAIVGGVLRTVEDRNEEVRGWAIHALDSLAAFAGDERPAEWIAIFRRVLERDPAPGIRASAAHGLGRYKASAAEVLAPLVTALRSPEPSVRAAAVLSLGWLGSGARSAAADVAARVADPDASVRAAAAHALGPIGVASNETVDALRAALSATDRAILRNAARSLGALASNSESAAVAVADFVRSERPDPFACADAIRCAAAGTARERVAGVLRPAFSGPDAAPAVAFALCALDTPERPDALRRLAALTERASGPQPNRTSAPREGSHGERSTEAGPRRADALAYLRLLGAIASGTTPAVARLLSDPDPAIRRAAAAALGAFGPAAKEALPALERLIEDDDETVAAVARDAVRDVRGDAGTRE